MTKKINKRKAATVVIDKSLEKYKDIELFPDKVAKANEMLRTVGLPHKLNVHSKRRVKRKRKKSV